MLWADLLLQEVQATVSTLHDIRELQAERKKVKVPLRIFSWPIFLQRTALIFLVVMLRLWVRAPIRLFS